jgi:hypothetical protein
MVVNIGLNVGGFESVRQGFKTLGEVLNLFTFGVHDFRVDTGSWYDKEEGAIVERSLVFRADSGNLTPFALHSIFVNLCVLLEQDAIAFKVDEVGYITFNPSYEGEKFKFNEQYFINF